MPVGRPTEILWAALPIERDPHAVTITYGSQPGTGGDMGDILHVLYGRDTIERAAVYPSRPPPRCART